jgi:hypothetical protein
MTHALPLLLALACASDPAGAAILLEGKWARYRVVVAQHFPCGLCEVKAPAEVKGVVP